jgi:uncharacterized protein (DUF1697 family)
MRTYVALLRGVNVGGKNTVPMAELRSTLTELGYEDVVTYIQSGNLVLRTRRGKAEDVAATIENHIAATFDKTVTVMVRTPAELEAIAEGNPFLSGKEDVSKLHVVFLASAPPAKAAAELDPSRSPPDEFRLQGREIYLRLPNGMGRSKLTIDYFERRLGVPATARNWKTLLKLIALAPA